MYPVSLESNTELRQKALPTASTKPKSNTPIPVEIPREEEDEREREEEQRGEQDESGEEDERTGDAIGKNLFDDEPAQQSKTNKRKNPGEDAIRNGDTKCHTSNLNVFNTISLSPIFRIRKRQKSATVKRIGVKASDKKERIGSDSFECHS